MDMEATRIIGKQLRRLRENSNLRQDDVAKALGKPQSYVSKLEAGEKSLHAYEIFSYADALNTPRIELLARIEIALTGQDSISTCVPHFEYGAIELPDKDA